MTHPVVMIVSEYSEPSIAPFIIGIGFCVFGFLASLVALLKKKY